MSTVSVASVPTVSPAIMPSAGLEARCHYLYILVDVVTAYPALLQGPLGLGLQDTFMVKETADKDEAHGIYERLLMSSAQFERRTTAFVRARKDRGVGITQKPTVLGLLPRSKNFIVELVRP